MELKRISSEAVPRALELAERYRLLNEPEQAASICEDILEVAPESAEALRTYLLAVTEQFHQRRGRTVDEARKIAARMSSDYERLYYEAIACERWGRAKLQGGEHAKMAADWLMRAMELYEKAEGVRATGNDDAKLRWNACARLLNRLPELDREEGIFAELGD